MEKENDITVGIKTFYRTKQLKKCLDSFVGHDFYEIIIADDGEIKSEKRKVYFHYSKILPITLLELPFDSGLSYGRNQIVEKCSTPYLLMLDDDQVIPSNIYDLKLLLNSNEEIGGISAFLLENGILKCTACNIFEEQNYIIKDVGSSIQPMQYNRLTYYVMDSVPNSTLFRLEGLKDISWDNAYKIGREHIDFFLSHKRLGRWKFAVTPDVVIEHNPRRVGSYAKNFRHNRERFDKSRRYFQEKWGMKRLLIGQYLYEENPRKSGMVVHHMLKYGFPPKWIDLAERTIQHASKIKYKCLK